MTAAVGPAELRADRVTVRLGGRTILDEVSVTARRSHPLALTGASGSGKTTLLHVLAGIQIPAEGAVLADGRPLAGQTWTMGLILQNYGLVPFLTAEENVALPLQARATGADRGRIRDATVEALAAVGLEAVAGQLATDLSGGQRQRTAVARALVIEPAVLLADEPCAALDDRSAEIVLDLLAGRAAAGALVVISTHDPEVAARCPDHVDLSPA